MMPDPDVARWKLKGELHLWHYVEARKDDDGWHFSANRTTCESLTGLIELMLASPYKTSKQIEVAPPDLSHLNPDVKWVSASALLLAYPKGEVDDNMWELKAERNLVRLTLGREKLLRFQKSIAELSGWNDDYALGPDVNRRRPEGRKQWNEMCLWFWYKKQQ